MYILTFLLYGLVMTRKVSSEPDRMYSPVSFQDIVLTYEQTVNYKSLVLKFRVTMWNSKGPKILIAVCTGPSVTNHG